MGFAQTNSSIGEHIDKHYDVLSSGTAPIVATPRGGDLERALNLFEASLGLPGTKPVTEVTKKITWEESSSVGSIGFVSVI